MVAVSLPTVSCTFLIHVDKTRSFNCGNMGLKESKILASTDISLISYKNSRFERERTYKNSTLFKIGAKSKSNVSLLLPTSCKRTWVALLKSTENEKNRQPQKESRYQSKQFICFPNTSDQLTLPGDLRSFVSGQPQNITPNKIKLTLDAKYRNNKMAHWFHRNPIKASAPVTFESIRNVATTSSSSKMLS